ncbi:selenocysteine lyase [Advenella kashmirensis W13003]|uniref:Probable septum site-determining protein MinC n=1 Tax=Advenella kashmirensis W13003 TaxID=1424334 RepID=V8QNT4_9BURK|nr:septum site-determining protein MinC [Advenella kashmirensis]ETF01312.1 selenocysteine lyase [Advenella kashmirensis W13003]
MASKSSSSALEFKSASLFVVRIELKSTDTAALQQALEQKMAEAGSLFEHEPVVLDATGLSSAPDWNGLVTLLAQHKLPVIGVMGPDGALIDSARQAGLCKVEISTLNTRQPPEPTMLTEPVADAVKLAPAANVRTVSAATDTSATPPPSPPPAAAPKKPATPPRNQNRSNEPVIRETIREVPVPVPTMVLARQLRSGQRVYARNSDLIVIGVVSRGAEVIADGNIHVYGPLRGKAIAGARGNASARIFTSHLDAELLAIAGIYRVIDAEIEPALNKKPVIVELDNDTLRFIPGDSSQG